MDHTEIELLRTLLILMSEQSVSRAAERMQTSQPAASRALARLRKIFHDPLLLRSRTGMIPTDRAREIEVGIRELLARYDSLTKPVQPFDPAVSRRAFILTVPEYAEHLLMPMVFRRLREFAPNIRIEIHAPNPERSYELLEQGKVDLRIAWLRKPPPSLRSMPLFQDRIVCIADRDHPGIRGDLSSAQYFSLPQVRAYGTGRSTTGQAIDEAVERYGKKLALSFVVQNFLTIPYMIAGTDTIATLPRALALAFAARHPLTVFEVPLRLPRVKYSAYWHERSQQDAGHKWLRNIVRSAAHDLKWAE